MADFLPAYNFTMDNEDAGREYKIVPDVGGSAISGINSHSFPGEYAAIAAIAQHERGLAVEQFYERHFWNQWLAQLDSQDLANRVFDAAVNMGPGTAVKLLQRACNALVGSTAYAIAEDGNWGPQTVKQVNLSDESPLVNAFKNRRIGYYQAIVAADPSKAKYLPQWLARASK
jgi:lysozyme family protein